MHNLGVEDDVLSAGAIDELNQFNMADGVVEESEAQDCLGMKLLCFKSCENIRAPELVSFSRHLERVKIVPCGAGQFWPGLNAYEPCSTCTDCCKAPTTVMTADVQNSLSFENRAIRGYTDLVPTVQPIVFG